VSVHFVNIAAVHMRDGFHRSLNFDESSAVEFASTPRSAPDGKTLISAPFFLTPRQETPIKSVVLS
jgi:hypothetical protein